jgi:hypothetical protein
MLNVVNQTGGRMLPPWDAEAARLFTREGLRPVVVSLPAWDVLARLLVVLFLLDVGARRLAWGREDLSRAAMAAAGWVRSYTTVRQGDARSTLDAYRQVRDREMAKAQVARAVVGAAHGRAARAASDNVAQWGPTVLPKDPSTKPPAEPEKKDAPSASPSADEGMSGLMAAKRRAHRRFEEDQ